MNRTCCRSTLLICVILPVFAAGALSGLHLQNPTFDTDVSGWTAAHAAELSWDSLDADASADSGSALVTNSSPIAVDSTGVSQCVGSILGGNDYELSAVIRIPSNQTATGLAHLVVLWFEEPDCSTLLDLETSSSLTSATTDTWSPIHAVLVSPAETQSASVRLDVLKVEDSSTLRAHFDTIVLAEGIFRSAFESGDTSAWSMAVGLQEPHPISFISLQVTPSSVPPTGGSLALLALVKDDAGRGVPNAPVHFLTQAGSLDSGGALLTTDASGQATDTLTLTAGDIEALGSRTFSVRARTVDFTGAQIEAVFQVQVQTGVPVADFSWTTSLLQVTFLNQSTGDPPFSFLWQFGDGTTSTLQDPIKVYSNPGDYTVCLSATNSVGQDAVCKTVRVTQ